MFSLCADKYRTNFNFAVDGQGLFWYFGRCMVQMNDHKSNALMAGADHFFMFIGPYTPATLFLERR